MKNKYILYKFKITTILLTQLHVRGSIWRECLIQLHDRSLYWSASPKPTVEWSAMSAVIRITASVYPLGIFKYSGYII